MAFVQIQPVVLCGGAGARLWPLSKPERPKPFLHLVEQRSLLAATLARVADRDLFLEPIIVAGMTHADALQAEVGSDQRLILEPCGRNTAPALAAAAFLADAPDRLLLVMPSDHVIQQPETFLHAVAAAAPLASAGWLMTFGVRPSRAETGYGYIRRGEALGKAAFQAAEFVEKPHAMTAEAYLASGNYDWNAGIFLLRADRFLEELQAHAPEVAQQVKRSLGGGTEHGSRECLDPESFGRSPSVSIDVAVMEKADRVGVIPVEMGWSDVGTWDAVYDAARNGDSNNVIHGPVDSEQSRGCYFHSEGPKIIAIDVEDLIVVATADGVLVTRRGGSQSLKTILERGEGQARLDRVSARDYRQPPPPPAQIHGIKA